MPTVSIIIPAHNREQYLEECVRSALTQTFSTIEILIINDASTDTTGAIADELAKADSRIRVIHHSENKLRSGALNTGLDHATGEYISFLDSDDYYLTDKLERQVAFLQSHPESDGVYGDFEMLLENAHTTRPATAIASTEKIQERLIARSQGQDTPIMSEGYIPSCSVLIRSAVFKTIRFDSQLRNMEDLDIWLQILGAGFTLTKLPGSTYVYRRHGDQKSSNPERMKLASEIIEGKIDSGIYLGS